MRTKFFFVLLLAIACLLGLPAAWRWVRPDVPTPAAPTPIPAAGPLTVTSLSVRHFRAQGADRFDDLGAIGRGGGSE